MYVQLRKLYSELPIIVNTDRIVTIESTSFPPGACRINGTLLVEGPLEDILKKLDGKIRPENSAFAKAVRRETKATFKPKRLKRPKTERKKNEQP